MTEPIYCYTFAQPASYWSAGRGGLCGQGPTKELALADLERQESEADACIILIDEGDKP